MYSQDRQDFNLPPARAAVKKWHQSFWGRAIIAFLAVFFTLFVALAIYVGQVVILLRAGELTTDQLFGQSGQTAAERVKSLYGPNDPYFGKKDAKAVIVEFGDFECPACQAEYPVVKEILKNYGDKILFVFRDFPLIASHPNSLLAAVAGHCAWEQGKFWEMHDKIFEIKDLSAAALQTYGRQIGLNPSQFSACLRSDKYLKEIETDLNEGYSAGVRATPTFFVNGVKVAGALDLMTFEKIIIEALSR